MTEELNFPMLYDTCPNCGGKRRIAQSVIASEIAKNKMGKESTGGIRVTPPVILADPRTLIVSAPALMVIWDICTDCGTEYVIRVDKVQATPGVPPAAAGKAGLPSGWPNPMGQG